MIVWQSDESILATVLTNRIHLFTYDVVERAALHNENANFKDLRQGSDPDIEAFVFPTRLSVMSFMPSGVTELRVPVVSDNRKERAKNPTSDNVYGSTNTRPMALAM